MIAEGSHSVSPAEVKPLLTRINVQGWRQFGKVMVELHPRVTIITGSNATGKTTILKLLSTVLGWKPGFTGSIDLESSSTSNGKRFKYGVSQQSLQEATREDGTKPSLLPIGGIKGSSNAVPAELRGKQLDYRFSLFVPESGASQSFSVQLQSLDRTIELDKRYKMEVFYSDCGIYIPSNRQLYRGASPTQVFTSFPGFDVLHAQYVQGYRQLVEEPQTFYGREGDDSKHREYQTVRSSLVTMALQSSGGSRFLRHDQNLETALEEYESLLRELLPTELGFEKLIIDPPDALLECKTGTFSIEAVSGGLDALIDLSWQLFTGTRGKESFVALIDEPETHLHPAMQRLIMPRLISAFPKVQFIVATHSPLVIGSVEDCRVYVLRHDDNNLVCSLKLDEVDKAGTADDILREVLGLGVVEPMWVEEKIESILSDFMGKSVDKDSLEDLRQQLKGIGFERAFPSAVEKVVELSKKHA